MGHEGTGACIQCKYQYTVIVEVWMLTIFCKTMVVCVVGGRLEHSCTIVHIRQAEPRQQGRQSKYLLWEGDFADENGKQREVKDGKILNE